MRETQLLKAERKATRAFLNAVVFLPMMRSFNIFSHSLTANIPSGTDKIAASPQARKFKQDWKLNSYVYS